MPRKKPTTPARKNASPAKPRPDFPLTPHPSGRWRKIHKGRAYWFGPLDDPEGAERRYDFAWPHIREGRPIPATPGDDEPEQDGRDEADYTTLRDAVNLFLEHKKSLVDTGELSPRSYDDYTGTARLILSAIDPTRDIETIGGEDFRALRAKLAEGRGLVSLSNHIARVRGVFKFAEQAEIRIAPVRYGVYFNKPAKQAIAREREGREDKAGATKAFTADEARRIIEAATPPMQAMILLALNCGFGNTDIAALNRRHIQGHIVALPRVKNGTPRRAVLWAETIKALAQAEDARGKPTPANKNAVFVTRTGNRWARHKLQEDGDGHKLQRRDAITHRFARLVKSLDIHAHGRSFYGLRHTFRTLADDHHDRHAVDVVMGHKPANYQGSNYAADSKVDDARLKAVADHVRNKIFAKKKGRRKAKK